MQNQAFCDIIPEMQEIVWKVLYLVQKRYQVFISSTFDDLKCCYPKQLEYIRFPRRDDL